MKNKIVIRVSLVIFLVGFVILAIPFAIAPPPIQNSVTESNTPYFFVQSLNKNTIHIFFDSPDVVAKIQVLQVVGNETQVVVPEFTYSKPVSFSLSLGYYIIQVTVIDASTPVTLTFQQSDVPVINYFVGIPTMIAGIILFAIATFSLNKKEYPNTNHILEAYLSDVDFITKQFNLAALVKTLILFSLTIIFTTRHLKD